MSIAAIFGQAVLGWLAADLATGAFHFWEDRHGKESWPVIGPWLIVPNRQHHNDPLLFTLGGFADRNLASIVASILIAGMIAAGFGLSVFLVMLTIGGALSNEVHRFAHQPTRAPGWIRVLQQIGALQSPRGHAAHHRPPHDGAWCVLTDWCNPVIEALRGRVARRA